MTQAVLVSSQGLHESALHRHFNIEGTKKEYFHSQWYLCGQKSVFYSNLADWNHLTFDNNVTFGKSAHTRREPSCPHDQSPDFFFFHSPPTWKKRLWGVFQKSKSLCELTQQRSSQDILLRFVSRDNGLGVCRNEDVKVRYYTHTLTCSLCV